MLALPLPVCMVAAVSERPTERGRPCVSQNGGSVPQDLALGWSCVNPGCLAAEPVLVGTVSHCCSHSEVAQRNWTSLSELGTWRAH